MKIICTEHEAEWIKKLMIDSDNCTLECECKFPCERCIEENVEFKIEK